MRKILYVIGVAFCFVFLSKFTYSAHSTLPEGLKLWLNLTKGEPILIYVDDEDYGPYHASPFLFKDKVCFFINGPGDQVILVAYDPETGEQIPLVTGFLGGIHVTIVDDYLYFWANGLGSFDGQNVTEFNFKNSTLDYIESALETQMSGIIKDPRFLLVDDSLVTVSVAPVVVYTEDPESGYLKTENKYIGLKGEQAVIFGSEEKDVATAPELFGQHDYTPLGTEQVPQTEIGSIRNPRLDQNYIQLLPPEIAQYNSGDRVVKLDNRYYFTTLIGQDLWLVEYESQAEQDADFFLNTGKYRSGEEDVYLKQFNGNRYDDLSLGRNFWNSHRFGAFEYDIPIENGIYYLNLFFKEIYFKEAGKRDFHVFAEDSLLLEHFNPDPKDGEITKGFFLEITDGALNLKFQRGLANHPMLSGLSLKKINPSNFIDAGSAEDQHFFSGVAYESRENIKDDILSFTQRFSADFSVPQQAFLTERYGHDFYYHLPVEEAGYYKVSLFAAETFWLNPPYLGPYSVEEVIKRRFSIKVGEQEVANNRVLNALGDKIETIVYADGPINLRFFVDEDGLDNAKINAIRWTKTVPPQTLYIDCGNFGETSYFVEVQDSIDYYSRLTVPDNYFDGGEIFNSTGRPGDFRVTERFGQDFKYTLPTSVGSKYRLLVFSGSSTHIPGDNRQFNLSIDDSLVLVNYRQTKIENYALDSPNNQILSFEFTAHYPFTTLRFFTAPGSLDYAHINALALERVDLDELTNDGRQIRESFLLYPNPAYSTFRIVTDALVKQIQIINDQGGSIPFEQGQFTPGILNIDVGQNVPAGLYQVIITTENSTTNKPVMLGVW
ncbi:malectin domain-containing carbohydrate-binding protein [Persicobacter diffluens]|uniref:Malectin domain-containing protein n=1 Tax=Persicobacter diffluens TaxID=981 RepID=A0AAN4W4C2_9BACT|nr:hypothetical protein PEDI_54340 [Persicobacter diffluens]